MKIKYLLLPLLLLLTVFSNANAMEPRIQRIEPENNLVRIEGWNGKSFEFIGSGSQIKTPHKESGIITAWHVLEDEQFVRLCGYKSGQCIVKYVEDFRRYSKRDIGLILVKEELAEPLEYSKKKLAAGDKVYSAGYPLGDFIEWEGQVVTRSLLKADVLGYCAPGSSGSMILDFKGKLTGIVVEIPVIVEYLQPQTSLCVIEVL